MSTIAPNSPTIARRVPPATGATPRLPSQVSRLGMVHDILIEQLSRAGCRFRSRQPFVEGSRIEVGLNGTAGVLGTIVRMRGDLHDCGFDHSIDGRRFAAAFNQTKSLHLPVLAHAIVTGSPVQDRSWSGGARMLCALAIPIVGWGLIYYSLSN